MKLKNRKIEGKIRYAMIGEAGAFSTLAKVAKSPTTKDNVQKWLNSPTWEKEEAEAQCRKEFVGKHRFSLPAALKEVEDEFGESYYRELARALEQLPKGIAPEDYSLEKDGMVVFAPEYVEKRIKAAEMELTPEEGRRYEELKNARSVIAILHSMGFDQEEISHIMFAEDGEEVAFNLFQRERIRKTMFNN